MVPPVWGEVDSRGRGGAMNDQIAQLAREAFWGKRPQLMALIRAVNGYTMNGIWWPANGISLLEVIATLERSLGDDAGTALEGMQALDGQRGQR